MLFSANELKGWGLQAVDGQIGKIDEFYFDDGSWRIRYLVVDVGGWLKRQRVLLIPETVTGVNPKEGTVELNLTQEEVANSPDALEQVPVSRQEEIALHRHYGWKPYWDVDPVGVAAFGHGPNTVVTPYEGVRANVDMVEDANAFAGPETEEQAEEMTSEKELRPSGRLHSSLEVRGYHIQAIDGDIGHVSDFFVNGALNEIRYLVVDTRNWLPGKKVVIPPNFVQAIHWDDSKVDVALTKEAIQSAPEYVEDSHLFLNSGFETELQEYYARRGIYRE
jgi:hypothetical protein